MVQARGETEAAVVLGESLFLVPLVELELCITNDLRRKYQFAAIMGFARIFFLDLGFWRLLGREDLFFFFWSSRPMLEKS